MQCKKCNQQLNEGDLFCSHCGETVQNPADAQEPLTKKSSKGKQILSSILSIMLIAVPIGIRNGIREHRRQQVKKEQQTQIKYTLDKVDTKRINEIVNSAKEKPKTGSDIPTTYTHENDFFGFGCKLQGWTCLSDEELREMDKTVIDNASDGSNKTFALKATRNDNQANIDILISDSSTNEVPDEKTAIEWMANQFSSNEGVTIIECIERNIGGENKYILKMVLDEGDTSLCAYQFFYFRENKRATVTITATSDAEADEICKLFYKTDIK